MHSDVEIALRTAIVDSLSHLQSTVTPITEVEQVWRRSAGGGWSSAYEQHLRLGFDFFDAVNWETASARIRAALTAYHPDHLGMVGTWSMGAFAMNAADLLRISVARLWDTHSTFAVPSEEIASVIADIGHFLDSPRITHNFLVPLINFRHPHDDPINVAPQITLRRIRNDEATRLYGGPAHGQRSALFVMPEWVLAGSFEDTKQLGGLHPGGDAAFLALRYSLDRVVLALRTFKTGPVGYLDIQLTTARFVPMLGGTLTVTLGHEYIPFGAYDLAQEDLPAFQRHMAYSQHPLTSSLEIACSRLSASSTRLNPRDQLLDVVVGMEAILLAVISDDQYRGELRFRFALHYALLEPRDLRPAAFRLARDLYDLRSKIAHGGDVPPIQRFGADQMAFPDIAARSCEMLRALLKRFLSAPADRFYTSDFWTPLYFGLPTTAPENASDGIM
jgi:hypothetical protein